MCLEWLGGGGGWERAAGWRCRVERGRAGSEDVEGVMRVAREEGTGREEGVWVVSRTELDGRIG